MRASSVVAAALFFASSPALALEPWVDPDPPGPPERMAIGESDFGVAARAEYRAQYTYVDPISLAEERNRRFNTVEHRGRITTAIDWDEKVKAQVSLDLLDGVLWGDNGTFGGDPSKDIGVKVGTRDPNVTRPCIGLRDEDTPLQADGYGYTLCNAPAVKVRRLFGEVVTPVGLLRVGRQAQGVGMGVQNAAGDGRRNRFGVSYEGDTADRVLFGTKPLEALKDKADRNLSPDEGLVTAVMYDRPVSGNPRFFFDAVHQIATAITFKMPDFEIGEDLELLAFHAHRWNTEYATYVHAIGGRAAARFWGFHVGIDAVANVGTTREVSEAYSLVSNDPVVDQDILQVGLRGVVRYDWQPEERTKPLVTGYFEVDYASGDRDPQPGTPLTQFRFSEDTNVGLLMFEHIVRFQSGRAARAGVEALRRLGAPSFPAERIDSRGAFTNAIAIFPQFDVRPHDTILFRGGALVAWGATDVVDPVQSLQNKDGQAIEDDLVNFVGGDPGNFYGVELDGRFQWNLYDHFALDLEAAVLFPGDALQNVNGAAQTSYMTQARTTFYF